MRSGFVAVAGRPNVGKSTLVNALCGGKVAIVSDKPQTTRQRIFGIANGDDWQLVLADLPGFQRPLDELTERMQKTVGLVVRGDRRGSFRPVGAGADRRRRPLHRVEGVRARRPGDHRAQQGRRLKPAHIAEQMSSAAKLAAGPKALAAGERFRADHPAADWVDNFHALHPVSAKTGDGVGELRDELVGLLPEGPLYFPQEQRSDLSVEMQIAELVREKALVADARRGAARDLRRGRVDRGEDGDARRSSSRPSRRSRSWSARAARW